jgi:predicted enzyme related to lactoylglutathione lyase
MSRVVHFEVHAEQPERAIRFYQELLGWEFSKWAGPTEYWLIKTGPDDKPGINGGLIKRKGPGPTGHEPVIGFVCTVGVTSVDETLASAVKLGGTVALPKMAIPGVGWLAYAKDTEGNVFGMMQNDPKAA